MVASSSHSQNDPHETMMASSSHSQAGSVDGGFAGTVVKLATLGALYITCSAGLISFNKYLMHEDRFPYAVVLVLLHTVFCSVFAMALYVCKPALFPSLTDANQKVNIDRNLILTGAMPIAFLFSAQLVLSNTAYLHSSVAFLQMLKEANLVLVYTFSLVAMLERFSWQQGSILLFVLFATTLTIHGEINFSMTGFVIQGTSQLFESGKIVLQAVLLSAKGRKLDAMTYVLLVMPLCFVFLSAFLAFLIFWNPLHHFAVPHMSEIVDWFPVLAVNACLAFALNVIIAMFVKASSAVAFIFAGLVKDAMIVCAGGLLFHEIISPLQTVGFCLQLLAILVWSLMKTFPQKFEKGIVSGLVAVLCSHDQGLDTLPRSQQDSKQYGTVEDAPKVS